MSKTCSVDGCTITIHRKGLCSAHSKRMMRHGSFDKLTTATHGLESDPIYGVWANMVKRCTDPRNIAFHNYGGRGITVCPEWFDVSRFNYDVCGHPGGGMTFDRVDVNGNYELGNVRWTTPAVQAQNRRNNKLDYDKVREIRKLAAAGSSERTLAATFGVDKSMIGHVVKRTAWKEDH